MKTYVLLISRHFPTTHKRKGDRTYFYGKIQLAIGCQDCDEKQDLTGKNISKCNSCHRHAMMNKKLHTIRQNYLLWAKRIKEVQEGTAILSLRHWSGKPYNSPQVEFAQLDKNSGVGIQKIQFNKDDILWFSIDQDLETHIEQLAKNDGLIADDFKDWFKNADLSAPMAIIHFTNFRY